MIRKDRAIYIFIIHIDQSSQEIFILIIIITIITITTSVKVKIIITCKLLPTNSHQPNPNLKPNPIIIISNILGRNKYRPSNKSLILKCFNYFYHFRP